MLPDSHSIQRRSLSFFFQDIALWPGRIWVLPQFVDVSLDLPGIGAIKALHILLSLKRYRYFECHKTASLPIFFALPLLDLFANPLILCCPESDCFRPSSPSDHLLPSTTHQKKSCLLKGARPALGTCPVGQSPPGCASLCPDEGKLRRSPDRARLALAEFSQSL